MTNEKASVIIGNIPVYGDDCYSIADYQEAKTLAIKALEQLPCDNAISRQKAIEIIQNWLNFDTGYSYGEKNVMKCTINELMDLPSVICLEKPNMCGDVISIQTVKEQMIKYGFHAPDMTITEFIEDLSSISKEKTDAYN